MKIENVYISCDPKALSVKHFSELSHQIQLILDTLDQNFYNIEKNEINGNPSLSGLDRGGTVILGLKETSQHLESSLFGVPSHPLPTQGEPPQGNTPQ